MMTAVSYVVALCRAHPKTDVSFWPLATDNAAQRYVRSWVKIGSDYCPLGMSRLTHNVTSPPLIDALRKVHLAVTLAAWRK